MVRGFQLARRCIIGALVCVACVACASATPAIPARPLAPLVIDSRLRIELASPAASPWFRRRQTLVGTMTNIDSSVIALRVRPGDPAIHVPTAAVHAVYTSLGPRSRVRAATVGGLRSGAVGLVSGLIMAAFTAGDGTSASRVVIGRAAFGAALGIGVAAPGERWQRVRLPESPGHAASR